MSQSTGSPARSLRPYPTYKDSRVEWPGQIPGHWSMARIAEQAELINGYPFESELFHLSEGVPLVRIRDLGRQKTELFFSGPSVPVARITSGDILIGMDGDFSVAEWRGESALLNQRLCCLRPRATIDRRFLLYSLPFPLQVINDLTYSTTVKHLSSVDVRKIQLTFPPAAEQQAIANFLDRETAKIDGLIAKKQRLIELLEEKRAALITHAVTRGLDPNVPTKESGVEWLGQIPAHWEVQPLKRIASIRYGLGEPPQQLAGGLPFIRATNVTRGRIVDHEMQFVDPQDVPWNRDPVLRSDDIIVVRSGAYTGDSAIIPAKYDGAIAGYDMAVRSRRGWPRFLAWTLLSRYVLEAQLELESMRAAQPHLNAEELGAVLLLRLPDSEQRAIAAFLDRETAKIDALVTKICEAVDKLREYRTALISAAVTGKIDVQTEAG